MRLIVLIRSFNPRRTQFILQDIETRGKSFNPRAHTGRDRRRSKERARGSVSIHAPTRGATHSEYVGVVEYVFQSTRPHGARHIIKFHLSLVGSFNPRAHTGRDVRIADMVGYICKFQSTRPHGARPLPCFFCKIPRLFQSTRPHGARR